MEASILGRVQQAFEDVPDHDSRAKIGPRNFVVTLVLTLVADSGKRTLESLRRGLISKADIHLSRSSFWQRLSSDRLLSLLTNALSALIKATAMQIGVDKTLLEGLGVSRIYLHDSSSISLPHGASEKFPAPRNNVIPAAIKWHSCIDLFSGAIRWYRMTAATDHDRNSFPPLNLLKGALIIFDLGYWDYQLMADLISHGCYFLSRIKTNAVIEVTGTTEDAPKYKLLGRNLFDYDWSKRRGGVIEVLGSFKSKGEEIFEGRVIGFWNPADKCYHWYVTNLAMPAELIYPLYRLRWQLELAFKAAKSTLDLSDITSSNSNIIRSLCLLSAISYMLSQPIARAALSEAPVEKRNAVSFQRAAHVLIHVATELRNYLLDRCRLNLQALKRKLQLYAKDLFDPNYKKRETSLQRAVRCAENLC